MFASFFDEDKTAEENKRQSDKAKHNRDILLYTTAALALFTAVCSAAVAGKKVYNEFV